MGTRWKDGYSARVELYLLVGDERYDIAQVGPGSFVLRDTNTMIAPGTQGDLVIIIDGRKKSHSILLHDGAIAGCEEVAYF